MASKSYVNNELSPDLMSRFTATAAILTGVFAVIVVGLITASVYMWTTQARGIADAFRPQVDSRTVLSGTIEKLQTEGKLVVLSADVWAEARSSTRKKILYGLLDLGKSSVQVRAPARVQYVISLKDVTRDDFLYDQESRRLVLAVPSPLLDTSIVEVAVNPNKVDVDHQKSWLQRIGVLSEGQDENRARTLLRDAAIHAGRSGHWSQEAHRSAEAELRRLLDPMLMVLREDVTFEIVFYDGSRPRTEDRELPRPASASL